MSNFGTIRPANFDVNDAEVFYVYQPNQYTSPNPVIQRLKSSDVLRPIEGIFDGDRQSTENIFGGLYELTLPQNLFSETGIYTIHIRPKEVTVTITDCGVLNNLPNIKGLVFNSEDESLSNIDDLTGYRVEYITNGIRDKNLFRMITSTLTVEPISDNMSNNVTQKNIKYRPNTNASLIFCTLQPSTNPIDDSVNITPFIGEAGQSVILSNTFFDPQTLTIELVDENISTIANILVGNQVKKIEDGKYIVYDRNTNQADKAYILYEVNNDFGSPLYEVRERTDSITPEEQDFNTLKTTIN